MSVYAWRKPVLTLSLLIGTSASCWGYEQQPLKNNINLTEAKQSLKTEIFFKTLNTKGIKVASVCFITDAGNCSGDKFGNVETPGGGGGKPDDHGTPQELCQDAGFTNTPCPTGSTIDSYCPYDSSYHTCKCLPEYNKLCNGADEQGSGVACDGKYKECCNLCSAYKYTSIPSGYVSNGECQSCSGKKYKIKCDPQKYVSGSSCGTQGGSGSTCSDDFGTYYQKCNCPNNYEWSDTQKKCVCSLLSNIHVQARDMPEEMEQLVTVNIQNVNAQADMFGMPHKELVCVMD